MALTMGHNGSNHHRNIMPPIISVVAAAGPPCRKLPPPPILRHHRPDEFAFANRTLTNMAVDSELLPIGSENHDWFPRLQRNDIDEGATDRRPEEEEAPHSHRVSSVHESQIDCDDGMILGSGGFCEVRLVRLRSTTTDDGSKEDGGVPRLYAMKYLSPSKFAPETYRAISAGEYDVGSFEPRSRNHSFERGIADLVVEARFLALVSHENIIKLHHVGRGSLAGQYNCRESEGGSDVDGEDGRQYDGHRFGFFLMLDPLFETLSMRIERTYIPRAFDRFLASSKADVDRHVVPFPRRRMHLSLGSNSWWRLAMHPPKDPCDDSRLDALRADLAERLGVIKCIASGLAYLHDDCHAICRDVKPDNIGFYRRYRQVCRCGARSTGRDGGCSCYDEVPKLFDFGLCKELKSTLLMAHPDHGSDVTEATYKLTGRCGTRRYMAPEVALSCPYNDKVDVYSLGVTLYQVSSLVSPFWAYSSDRHEKEILHGGDRPSLEIPSSRKVASLLARRGRSNPYERWLGENDLRKKYNRLELRTKCVWTEELQCLIQDCWQGDIRLRPTMRDVVTRLEDCIQEFTRIKRDESDGIEGNKMRMTGRSLSQSI